MTGCTLRHQSTRRYSSKPPALLVSKLRKETNASLSKIIQALTASDNSIPSALEWLAKDALASGTAKAAKSDRIAAEGVVYSILNPTLTRGRGGIRGVLLEVNSETDFAARGPLFQQFVQRAAVTGLMLGESLVGAHHFGGRKSLHALPVDKLLHAPSFPPPPSFKSNSDSIPSSIEQPLKDHLSTLIGTIGERVTLRRAHIALPPPRISTSDSLTIVSNYVHTLPDVPEMGRMGAMVVMHARDAANNTGNIDASTIPDIESLGRKIAQHVTGFNPSSVWALDGANDETVLMKQEFLCGGGTVEKVLNDFQGLKGVKLEIADFVRYECAEGIEKVEANFAEEVQKQLQ
ncbi:hypothetical protein SeLEV6574_g05903 [Synchytrium endobioticum]|uniref:Elongation factor Ts, mitochondrial n=1 Tax=Synchytrium endobioticum TaxID=286115 RepID=A0A507CRP8_9FUNG|nr:hypothetical protein SeLEV6574_g05903 [Synchytrium endobioticum]